MNYDLGEKLKYLRKKRDLTQEQLAEYFGVSFQAISKWETNSAMPDISMFPILANFYGVTTDELLGVDISKTNDKINAYLNKADELYKAWKLKDMVDVARKACAEFPGNDKVLYYLAWSLGQAQNVIRTKSENLNEAIKIAERILSDSTDTAMRLKTTSLLSYLYHWNGNDEKSLEYANQLPRLTQTSGYLIGRLGLKKRA
ncbi:MAG: helix-turn-helix transcriptional regulator, partial [Eubacteriales bacterium]